MLSGQESNKKGAELAKKQAGKPKRKMSEKEYAAIMLYTSNAIYADLNKSLRDNNRGKVKKRPISMTSQGLHVIYIYVII